MLNFHLFLFSETASAMGTATSRIPNQEAPLSPMQSTYRSHLSRWSREGGIPVQRGKRLQLWAEMWPFVEMWQPQMREGVSCRHEASR